MITAANKIAGFEYSRYLSVNELDNETLKKAKNVFHYYIEQKVIVKGSFDDNEWIVTDEKSKIKIRFDYDDAVYETHAQKWIECSSNCYRETIKTYIIFLMGSRALNTLRSLAGRFRDVARSNYPEDQGFEEDSYHIAEMLRLIPGTSQIRDCVIDFLDECYENFSKKKVSPRKLMDFPAYFKFNDALSAFWAGADELLRLYYFPIYLWWNLTAILPLRVNEFLLLPEDCIHLNGEEFFITVRRTKLKGIGKQMTYKVDGDYEKKSYPLSEMLAKSILWYKSKTKAEEKPPIDALFCLGPYKLRRKSAAQKIFNYVCLDHLKEDLYRDELPQGTPKIKFGDTRHIAMMNLIISGDSPRMCMELAGHANIGISSHYYANMTSLIECATYELYRKNRKGTAARVVGKRFYSLEPTENMVRMKHGWCGSLKRKNFQIDDCILSVNSLGEIGDCESCRYFRRDLQGTQVDFFDTDHSKNKVKADSWFLMQMFEAVRKGIGYPEDIQQAILRLQSSSNHYKECLWKEYEVKDHAKAEETEQ